MSSFSHINDGNLRLTPRDEKLSCTEKLKRSELEGLDASLWDELCIAASENEPTDSQLLSNTEFSKETREYMRLKLTPDQQLYYADKPSLKKSTPRVGLWICVAAAAIALLFTLPAILQNNSPEAVATPLADAPINKVEVPNSTAITENHETADTMSIARTESTSVTPKTKAEKRIPSNKPASKEKEANPVPVPQEIQRHSITLSTVAPIQQTAILAANTTEGIKLHPQQGLEKDTMLFASVDDAEPIGVERPSFLDKLRAKSIVNVNKLLGEGTIVVKEYDKNGKLTLYAVQSNTLYFEKNYTE